MGTIIFLVAILLGLIVGALIAMKQRKKNAIAAEKRINDQTEYLESIGVTISKNYIFSRSLLYEIRLVVDDVEKMLYFSRTSSKIIHFPYSEVIGCEVVEDKQVMGQIQRAVAGGVIAGGTGAIVGALSAKKKVESLKVIIYRNNVKHPKLELTLIDSKTETNSELYKTARHFANNIYSITKIAMHKDNSRDIKEEYLEKAEKKKYVVMLYDCGEQPREVVKCISDIIGASTDTVWSKIEYLPCRLCVSRNARALDNLVKQIARVGGDASVEDEEDSQISLLE